MLRSDCVLQYFLNLNQQRSYLIFYWSQLEEGLKEPSPIFQLFFKLLEILVSQEAHIFIITHVKIHSWKVKILMKTCLIMATIIKLTQ